jgi:hypothetical protein
MEEFRPQEQRDNIDDREDSDYLIRHSLSFGKVQQQQLCKKRQADQYQAKRAE